MASSRAKPKILPVKFSKNANIEHNLYLKRHKVKNSAAEKPTDRTLLVMGIPPYVTIECMQRLFSHYGEVDNIYFQDKPSSGPPPKEKFSLFDNDAIKGFKVAYVIFKDEEGHFNAVNREHMEPVILSTKKHPLVTGLGKWMMEYNSEIYDPGDLQSKIDTFMGDYDKQIEKEKQQEKEQEGIPDEDGWVTVTKSKHNATASHTETVNKKALKKERQRRQEKELLNFYGFQIRDSKKEHINQLKQKFEEDKKRVKAMKENRRFRPY